MRRLKKAVGLFLARPRHHIYRDLSSGYVSMLLVCLRGTQTPRLSNRMLFALPGAPAEVSWASVGATGTYQYIAYGACTRQLSLKYGKKYPILRISASGQEFAFRNVVYAGRIEPSGARSTAFRTSGPGITAGYPQHSSTVTRCATSNTLVGCPISAGPGAHNSLCHPPRGPSFEGEKQPSLVPDQNGILGNKRDASRWCTWPWPGPPSVSPRSVEWPLRIGGKLRKALRAMPIPTSHFPSPGRARNTGNTQTNLYCSGHRPGRAGAHSRFQEGGRTLAMGRMSARLHRPSSTPCRCAPLHCRVLKAFGP